MSGVDVLAVMRRTANRLAARADALASGNRPGHCDYVSKTDAATGCKADSASVEEARAAVAELMEQARITSAWLRGLNADGELFAELAGRANALDAALARMGGSQ